LNGLDEMMPLEVLDVEFLTFEERMVNIPLKYIQSLTTSQNSQILATIDEKQPSNFQIKTQVQ
jgi:hypothetical protein